MYVPLFVSSFCFSFSEACFSIWSQYSRGRLLGFEKHAPQGKNATRDKDLGLGLTQCGIITVFQYVDVRDHDGTHYWLTHETAWSCMRTHSVWGCPCPSNVVT